MAISLDQLKDALLKTRNVIAADQDPSATTVVATPERLMKFVNVLQDRKESALLEFVHYLLASPYPITHANIMHLAMVMSFVGEAMQQSAIAAEIADLERLAGA